MPSLLALTWRLLLIVGLVFNPVAGMGMGVGAAMAAEPASEAAKAPPCHGDMAMQAQAAQHDSTAPCPDAGKDCGHFLCKYGACCLAGALDRPVPAFVPVQHDRQAVYSHDLSAAATPPPSRMMRPPIG